MRLQRTIFQTPVVSTLVRGLSWLFIRGTGWRVEGRLPEGVPKCVLIGAPHTSNWDMPYALTAAFLLRLNLYWMGKASIFRFPFGALMRWLGGIAVHREKRNNLVAETATALQAAEGSLQLAVPPEGTRGKVRQWKTGFYFIAQQAQVPVVMAYMDYGRKVVGIGPVFTPSGDLDRDMLEIKRFYAGMKGRNADQFAAE